MNQFERQHIERMIKEIKQKGEIPIVKQAYYLYQNLGNIYQYKSNLYRCKQNLCGSFKNVGNRSTSIIFWKKIATCR